MIGWKLGELGWSSLRCRRRFCGLRAARRGGGRLAGGTGCYSATSPSRLGASQGVQGATVLHRLAGLYKTTIQGATKCNAGCYIPGHRLTPCSCLLALISGSILLAVNPSPYMVYSPS